MSVHFWISLSHSRTLRFFLGHFNIGSRKAKKENESKDQARKSRIKQLKRDYLQVSICICDFLAIFGMHGTCMCVFGSLVFIGMGFSRCDNDFSLVLPFLDSHGVMGLFHLVELDFRMVLEPGDVVS